MSPSKLRPLTLVAACTALALTLTACSGDDGEKAAPTPSPSGVSTPTWTVDESVGLRVLPRIADPGTAAREAEKASFAVEVDALADSAGTNVELEVEHKGEWQVASGGTLDERGDAVLTSPWAGSLRVVMDRAAGVRSEMVNTDSAPEPSLTDDFDTLDAALWQTRHQGYAGVRQCSRSDDSAATVRAGVLSLQIIDDPERAKCRANGRTHDYRLNGHVGTEGRYALTYGTIAARVRFQPKRGQHGAFWLQSPWLGTGPAQQHGAEIDVIEYFGDGTKTGGLTQWVYWHPDEEIRKVGGFVENHKELGDNWSSKYHVFSVEWTPKQYTFRIDGKVSFRTKQGVSGVPQFIVLSMLSSDYELKHVKRRDLPQSMDVDWVRTWGPGEETGTFKD